MNLGDWEAPKRSNGEREEDNERVDVRALSTGEASHRFSRSREVGIAFNVDEIDT